MKPTSITLRQALIRHADLADLYLDATEWGLLALSTIDNALREGDTYTAATMGRMARFTFASLFEAADAGQTEAHALLGNPDKGDQP